MYQMSKPEKRKKMKIDFFKWHAFKKNITFLTWLTINQGQNYWPFITKAERNGSYL